jgi:hypothetical protein
MRRHKNKHRLILDRKPYRYQQFLTDISEQDIAAHGGDATALIAKVRDWLNTVPSPDVSLKSARLRSSHGVLNIGASLL